MIHVLLVFCFLNLGIGRISYYLCGVVNSMEKLFLCNSCKEQIEYSKIENHVKEMHFWD